MLNDYSAALPHLREAASRAPTCSPVLLHLAANYAQLQRDDEARAEVDLVRQVDPKSRCRRHRIAMVRTRVCAHLRNVIPVTRVTPRGDGLWSIDAHAIAVCAERMLITSLCTISDRVGVNRSRPDRDY